MVMLVGRRADGGGWLEEASPLPQEEEVERVEGRPGAFPFPREVEETEVERIEGRPVAQPLPREVEVERVEGRPDLTRLL